MNFNNSLNKVKAVCINLDIRKDKKIKHIQAMSSEF